MVENKPLAIPQELLDEVRYEKGNLYWAAPKQGRSTKKPICQNRDRYASVHYQGTKYLVHRVIYALHHGDPGDLHIDHINLNKRDNRIENLRAVTQQQNSVNYPGLNIRKRSTGGFYAYIGRRYLGVFKSYQSAVDAKLKERERILNER